MPRIDYDKLLASIPIDEVAKRLGMELRAETRTKAMALCPFHDDKTPSLLIDSSRDQGRQHFHCFACGEHGDAIDLVKELLKVDFKGALEWLSSGFSIASTSKLTNARRAQRNSSPEASSGLELALSMYLSGSNAERLDAWIAERRLEPAIIRRAGFAHATSNFLSGCLDADKDRSQKRERAGLLEDAYLIRRLFPGVKPTLHLPLNEGNDSSTRYGDFFIGERVVFPLYNDRKQLVGLGARSVGNPIGSASPKYQFTRGFTKAQILYRAEHAFEQLQKGAKQGKKAQSLFLCEGFLDALRLESIGLEAVAVMGNSLSDQQAQLIKVLCDSLPGKDTTVTVNVCFDRDEAGLRGGADACLKLLAIGLDCKFCWPTGEQLSAAGVENEHRKDPNDYLSALSAGAAIELLNRATYDASLAVLAFAFGTTADDTLNDSIWNTAPRSRRLRAFTRASAQLKRAVGKDIISIVSNETALNNVHAQMDWAAYLGDVKAASNGSLSDEFLTDARARLNHARLLAYMGSKRGELPCDEPRWERLDIAATAFNTLLVDRLQSRHAEPLGSYDAVWAPRSFGGSEPRLKMMPRPEDLTIQQYLLNEILTERWDHGAYSDTTFSRSIPAVRYYREERRTVTTGFDTDGKCNWGELNARTLSFAYQIDMDVVEGRQPASSQGMYRPFHECWLDFIKSVSRQASEIGYVYAVRLDVKRYYDRLRRYVVRDSLQSRLTRAIESVTGDTPGFAELLGMQTADTRSATEKATAVLERLDEQLFGVAYRKPDTGVEEVSDPMQGIPQGPVLSAWIGSIALFPLDEEANRIIDRLNTDRTRVGYARYVDDIVLLADSPTVLSEMRESIDRQARALELTLLAKADEIPAMSAEDFSVYINQGRALAASGPAWEPPLIGDGESGWDFWSVAPTTDRQSALQLLHNVELYKAPASAIIQAIKTALKASDLRTSELPKAARLLWYAIACEHEAGAAYASGDSAWERYLVLWNECVQGASWRLLPEKHSWESPLLFGIEGLEQLLDTKTRDVQELTAEENASRRCRIELLANFVLDPGFTARFNDPISGPQYQREARFQLLTWKALRTTGHKSAYALKAEAERAPLVQTWRPFEWMHEAIARLAASDVLEEDALQPFVQPFTNAIARSGDDGFAARLFQDLLPDREHQNPPLEDLADTTDQSTVATAAIALQTLASVVPRSQILACLGRRPRLLAATSPAGATSRLLLPPLPGIRARRLFSCLIDDAQSGGSAVARGFEVIELNGSDVGYPEFVGADSQAALRPLALDWCRDDIAVTNGLVCRLEGKLLPADFLRLRVSTDSMVQPLAAGSLRLAASMYRAIAAAVRHFALEHDGLGLVPAWPYIAQSMDGQAHYVIGEGVLRAELGNRAFVRDGGRALRTIEVPIYEADLWRVGAAVSDFIGLHDDVAKFSSAEVDVTLDAVALANPARYVLRSQMRKLRGAFADSKISKRQKASDPLPPGIERALRLLEGFPDESASTTQQLAHVLAIEAESAAMYLSLREQWTGTDGLVFLMELTGRLISRLPLSVSKDLALDAGPVEGLRRDLTGAFCLSKQLHSLGSTVSIPQEPAWRALLAGTVCTGISVALQGMVASMRSHPGFEANDAFDFPTEWNVAASASPGSNTEMTESEKVDGVERQRSRLRLVDQLRAVVRRLGHRIRRESTSPDRLSDDLYGLLESVVRRVAQAEYANEQADEVMEWPFDCLHSQALDLLNLDLLEMTTRMVRQLDVELGFELILAKESSYGYNAQTRRFVDSRNGSWEATPWMISQFPRGAKHIEERTFDGRITKIWSEVYDRNSGRLLSVSALGEPFASIAIKKEAVKSALSIDEFSPEASRGGQSSPTSASQSLPLPAQVQGDADLHGQVATNIVQISSDSPTGVVISESENGVKIEEKNNTDAKSRSDIPDYRSFRNHQQLSWGTRAESSKRHAHIRVALLQMSLDVTYIHPMMEACPSRWPFSSETRHILSTHLEPKELYEQLARATTCAGSEHYWTGRGADPVLMKSWEEHRRRRVLQRVIDSCEAFKVDLLVLPEYSIRAETVAWMQDYLAGKSLAVLAGTYMEYRQSPPSRNLTAPLTLLWPLPKEISRLIAASENDGAARRRSKDQLAKGLVLKISRDKKYRSIALNELIRPPADELAPLFRPEELVKKIQEQTEWEPTVSAVSTLLSQTRLPLKHVLELICSEIFLVSSPANYLHIAEDYREVRRRFGESGDVEEVEKDLKALAKHLTITGDGCLTRRSILAVPAATSRSADYWIAGQACQLAAGTTSVFANGIGGELVGGSCFIGRGSWKAADAAPGYLSSLTPYHGWSKGIYYNDRSDALSKNDQAVVIADIDPYNMLEGKPRPQTMPVPLQLVAYLPIVEHIDWDKSESSVLRSAGLPASAQANGDRPKSRIQNEATFWSLVHSAITAPSTKSFETLWKHFPDALAVSSRAAAFWQNGAVQPAAGSQGPNAFSSPALYDWIDVSLSLENGDTLAKVDVPPWPKVR